VGINSAALTRSYPKFSILIRRLRAMASGRPYFFNRQRIRLRVFREIDARIPFENYIETGTYLGMTTRFLAQTAQRRGAHVHSCEISEDYFAIARRTAGHLKNVRLHHGDSVEFLRALSPKISSASNFIYLDAHWYDYLPLRDELSLLANWPRSVVMIDDFKVPGDEGFAWDRYDDAREICLRYIEGCIGSSPVYFPNYPSHQEGTGIARGYCVIPMSAADAEVLDSVPLLKRFK
jgi:predicted O-methyltransferase YrrM